eukprot:403332273
MSKETLSQQITQQNEIQISNQTAIDQANSRKNSKMEVDVGVPHNFVSGKNGLNTSGRVIAMQEYQSNQMMNQQQMYSSHESNMGFSENNNSGGMMTQSRGQKRHNQIEPNVIVHNKDSSRGHSSAITQENKVYQGALGLNRQGHLQNPRMGQSEVRANKLQKNAYQNKKDWQAFPMKVQNLNQMVQIRKKKPKLKYYDKLQVKAQQERQIYSQQVQHRNNEPKRLQKILDGFLLLFSCRVKLPHEAIRSKLSGENIVDVREEDLVYFKQNLRYLDISDNSVYLEQLVNLQNLEELDIQYNSLDHLELHQGAFPQLQILNLSYNKIPTSHLQELQYMNKLRHLEIASNDLCTLPMNPNKLFSAMATIPNLKKLNLSRNRFKAFHAEDFSLDNLNLEPPSQVFPHLEELNFAFNLVEQEQDLMYCVTQLPSLLILTVTGNPFAIRGDPFATANLEQILHGRNGKLINETLQPPTYLRRQKSKRQDGRPPLMLNYNFPQSREMVVVRDQPLSRPMVHQEAEDLFLMPSKDQQQQLQAIDYQQEQMQSDEDNDQDQQNENKFFITEDEMFRGNKQKKSQKPQNRQIPQVDIIQEENNDPNIQDEENTHLGKESIREAPFDEDFGKIRMENFKNQCRHILGKPRKNQTSAYRNPLMEEFEDDQSEDSQQYENSQYIKNRDYDTYLDIINAYKTLKQAVNKPSTVHNPNYAGGSKGYLKMTIAATQHSKSKMNKDLLEYSLAHKQERISSTAVSGQRALLPQSFDSSDPTQNKQFMYKRPTWRKTKQEVIDEKVERLFESYKLMDDVNKKQMALQGIEERENKNKHRNKYFHEDEDDDEE